MDAARARHLVAPPRSGVGASVMMALLLPKEFPYPLPEPWPAALREIRDAIAGHHAARWVVGMYERARDASAQVRADAGSAASTHPVALRGA